MANVRCAPMSFLLASVASIRCRFDIGCSFVIRVDIFACLFSPVVFRLFRMAKVFFTDYLGKLVFH